jgi:dTDP-4-dehydrorhamnose 3,5-epimerase
MHPTTIEDCYLIKSDVHSDLRGNFTKVYSESFFIRNNIPVTFNECFYSKSSKNTLRGMHFQEHPHGVGKLIYCVDGEILDVFLDIRIKSKTFGLFESINLSGDSGNALFLPDGVAHGFLTKSSSSIVCYLQTGEYIKSADSGILWNSFGMNWDCESPILSDRDKKFIKLAEYKK